MYRATSAGDDEVKAGEWVNVDLTIIDGGNIITDSILAAAIKTYNLTAANATFEKAIIGSNSLVVSNFQNLVSNPGFEAGDLEWTKSADCSIANAGAQHNGLWYGNLAGIGSNTFVSNKFYVVPGEKYYYSGWMKYSADYAADGNTGINIYWYTAAGEYVSNSNAYLTPSTSWQEASGVTTVPATAAYGVFRFVAYSVTAGYARCDDAYVCRQRQSDDIEALAIARGNLALKVVGGAQIDDLAVDTLQVAGNAITMELTEYDASQDWVESTGTTISGPLVFTATGAPIKLTITCFYCSDAAPDDFWCFFREDGYAIESATLSVYHHNTWPAWLCYTKEYVYTPDAGEYEFTVEAFSTDDEMACGHRFFSVQEVKK